MATIRIKGDKHRYNVKDDACIGRPCLALHPVQVRGATSSGSRNTGAVRHECGRRAYHGCPQPLPAFDKELAAEHKRQGMKTGG